MKKKKNSAFGTKTWNDIYLQAWDGNLYIYKAPPKSYLLKDLIVSNDSEEGDQIELTIGTNKKGTNKKFKITLQAGSREDAIIIKKDLITLANDAKNLAKEKADKAARDQLEASQERENAEHDEIHRQFNDYRYKHQQEFNSVINENPKVLEDIERFGYDKNKYVKERNSEIDDSTAEEE